MIFIIILVIIAIISVFDYTNISVFSKRLLSWIIFLVFVFIAGFRYNFGGVGNDWTVYQNYFRHAPSFFGVFINPGLLYDSKQYYEVGFTIINVLLKTLTDNEQYFFLGCQIITSTLLYLNIQTYARRDKLICLFVYFGTLFLSLDLIFQRQIFAVEIFLLSIRFVEQKRLIPYIISVSLAGLIHNSAFFLYPVYFVLNRRFTNTTFLITIVVGLVLFILNIDFFTQILAPFHLHKFEGYAGTEQFNVKRGFGVTQIEIIIMIVLIITLRKKIEILDPKYSNIFINMYFIYSILILYFFSVSAFSGRLKFFFNISYIFIFPLFVRALKKTKYFVLGHLVVFVYLLATIVHLMYFYDSKGYIDYENYLFLP